MQREPLQYVPMSMGKRLLWARESAGYSNAVKAAKALGMPYGTYSGHENSGRGIPRDKILIYAQKFKVSAEWLLTGIGSPTRQTCPIVGIAGAGPDGSVLFSEVQGELGDAPMPPGGNERTVAVEVRGDSMRGIANSGWLVYYDERRDPPTEDLLGGLCVVGLKNGHVLVKFLIRGRGKGLFDLESVGAPTLRDEPVDWAAAVIAIVPRQHARRAGR